MAFPISLKQWPVPKRGAKSRSMADLLLVLTKLGITKVFDIRRSDYASAKQFKYPSLKSALEQADIEYVVERRLANRDKANTSEEYLTPERQEFLQKELLLAEKTGFLCYCTEAEQNEFRCHAAWVCDYLRKNVL
ncbi:MAG: DUF488 family protein [Candidatus Hermodarchaeota archaeon]